MGGVGGQPPRSYEGLCVVANHVARLRRQIVRELALLGRALPQAPHQAVGLIDRVPRLPQDPVVRPRSS